MAKSKNTKIDIEDVATKKKGGKSKSNPISKVDTEFVDFTVDIENVNKEVQEFHDSLIGKPVKDDADQKNNPFHGKEIAEDEVLLTEDNVLSTFQHYMDEAETPDNFRRAITNALKDKKKTKDIPQETYDGLKATMTILIPTLIEEQYETTVIEDVLEKLCLGLQGKEADLSEYLKLGESVELITLENFGEHTLELLRDSELTPLVSASVILPFEEYFAGKKKSKHIEQKQYEELSRMIKILTEEVVTSEMSVEEFEVFMYAALRTVLETMNYITDEDEIFLLRDMKTSEEMLAEAEKDKELLSTLKETIDKEIEEAVAKVATLGLKDTNQIIKLVIPRRKPLNTKEIYREVSELKYPC